MSRAFFLPFLVTAIFVVPLISILHAAEPARPTARETQAASAPSPLIPQAGPDWMLLPRGARPAAVTRYSDGASLSIGNGIVRRTFRLAPNAATVGLDLLTSGQSLLRAVEPEASLTIDGEAFAVGGLTGQPDRAYLTPEWISNLSAITNAFQFQRFSIGKPTAPFPWKRVRHAADLPWPPNGAALSLHFSGSTETTRRIEVNVHYELYDDLPVLGKFITLSNGTDRVIRLDRLTTERLAAVEAESAVDERSTVAWRTPAITVLSDYMFKGMDAVTGNQVARWTTDPTFTTQVSYELKTPCLLVCEPPVGPGVMVKPGETFTSFRSWFVYHDGTDRERQGLQTRRAHRTLAPWSTENPIMMHVRNSDTARFREAVDQCAEVGFETIIYTFGSGLNAESENAEYIARIKADVDYAHSKGIEVGTYSLFSSRRIDDANDVINPKTGKPGGAIFGNAPCFGSTWGLGYFQRLTRFLEQTGMNLLEHDGPYPGDVCASTSHPGHAGHDDSQWSQWRKSYELYAWCRARGIYVNQPDYYFFAGGNKTAMGYREVNWSLPRAQQILHARQNIFDGTWTKPASAGWMFVPLTEYHGGGPAATIEPLRDHLADYEAHLANTLGSGVQACWRGPRLFDAPETRDLVKSWVSWFKKHRAILESDIIHARRADGLDVDYLVHVNPALPERAFAMVHNPLPVAVERDVVLPLYYAGLTRSARVRVEDGPLRRLRLDHQSRGVVRVQIAARGRTYLVVEAP